MLYVNLCHSTSGRYCLCKLHFASNIFNLSKINFLNREKNKKQENKSSIY